MLPLNIRAFDLNLLKVFDVVMAEGSLTKAANVLALTQPAVSNALRRLRAALDDELLVRQGRGLQPTARALALWPKVRETLQHLELTLAPQKFSPATTTNTFVLTLADATAAELMVGLINSVTSQAPGVSLHVVPLTTRDPRRMLEEGQADLAIGHFPGVLSELASLTHASGSPRFFHQRLFASDYVCVMRKDHPLAAQPLTLDSYCQAHHTLVSFSGRAFGLIDEALAGLNKTRRVVLTVNQFFTTGKVVANSDLLAVLPRHFLNVTGFESELAVRELPFEVAPIHVDSLWHSRHNQDSAHMWFRDQIQAVATLAFPSQNKVQAA